MSGAAQRAGGGSEKIIIIPTYNERDNIGRLLERVMALPYGLHVLVVDDGSPDGTAEIVKEWQAKEPRVHMLQRPGKMGLGSAYRDGFRYALDRGFEYIFEMDADFSHDPDAIGGFLAAAEEADVVLGSRYLNGISPHAVLVTNRGAEEEIPIENEGIFTRLAPYALAPAAALALRQIIRWKGRR